MLHHTFLLSISYQGELDALLCPKSTCVVMVVIVVSINEFNLVLFNN